MHGAGEASRGDVSARRRLLVDTLAAAAGAASFPCFCQRAINESAVSRSKRAQPLRRGAGRRPLPAMPRAQLPRDGVVSSVADGRQRGCAAPGGLGASGRGLHILYVSVVVASERGRRVRCAPARRLGLEAAFLLSARRRSESDSTALVLGERLKSRDPSVSRRAAHTAKPSSLMRAGALHAVQMHRTSLHCPIMRQPSQHTHFIPIPLHRVHLGRV